MRARLGILPLALVGAGCGHLRPWTPSVSVAFWSEDVPEGKPYTLPSSAVLASQWTVPPGSPWGRYHKGTLISAVDPMMGTAMLPDVRRLDVVGAAEAAASHIAKVGLPADTLWVVDLRGAASAAFASRLSFASTTPIAPVVTFGNWPAPDGIVPADESLAGLLSFPPKLPPPDAEALQKAVPVFVLDSWRLAYRFDDPGDDAFDNRYMLMPSDLPDAAALQANGIKRVVYVVEDLDDAEVEEDDLNASFRSWQAAGVGIYLVDLDLLKTMPPPVNGQLVAAWDARLAPDALHVRDRWTLVDDPYFYGRARGGFGMMYGTPLIYPGYSGLYGGWGWGTHGGYGGYGYSRGGGGGGRGSGG